MKKFLQNLAQCDIKKNICGVIGTLRSFWKDNAWLYIRADSRQSSPASLPGFAGYFHCFTSLNMSRRSTHNHLLFTKFRLLKSFKKKTLQRQRQKSMIWLVSRENIIVLQVLHAFKYISMTQSAKRREIFQSRGSAANATLLKKTFSTFKWKPFEPIKWKDT